MSETNTDDVHVLYISGIGRSGSTLLCRTLGAMGGFLGTGELMRILERGFLNGDSCSCGAPVARCSQWGEVLAELNRLRPDLDLARLERTRRRVTEGWDLFRHILLPEKLSGLRRDLEEYRSFLTALYRSIYTTTGARIIVDASKSPVFGQLLTETPGVRIGLLHLVRDSRGFAHSLRRKKRRPGTNGRVEEFARHGSLIASVLWTMAHLKTESLGKRVGSFVQVRYEDFVEAPEATLRRVVEECSLGIESSPQDHISGNHVRLDADHLIASNPNRALRGEVKLRLDLAWKHEMSRLRQWLVTALTFPLLHRYGYLTPGTATRPSSAVASSVGAREPGS